MDAALGLLRESMEQGDVLARRGEVGSLRRICKALLTIVPAEQASRFWTAWLLSAASMGVEDTMLLSGFLIRYLPEEYIAGVTMDKSGRLQQSARKDQAWHSSLRTRSM